MVNHVKPTLRNNKPDHINQIQHTVTNNLQSEKTLSQTARSIKQLKMSLKNDVNAIIGL